jgi:glucose/mannose-6-phosphate isomerase
MMKDLIASFPEQLKEALTIFKAAELKPLKNKANNILISGLGGSGIGGSIIAEIAQATVNVPILVVKDYSLPAWVNENTLVIISSYSGNTEETLQVMENAITANAMIVCITSGGKVLELAQQNDLNCIQIPGGNPPRACLGYSFTQLCGILDFYEFSNGFIASVEQGMHLLMTERNQIIQEAEALSKSIAFSTPVIYTTSGFEGIAIRLRQQLNENAKMLCWHHVVPEMNHNELVGWVDKSPKIATLFLRNKTDYYRTAKRMDICKEIISQIAGKTLEINSKGEDTIVQMLYWIHLGDWISWFVSVERNVDAMEINVINRLKGELAELK